MNDFLKIAKDFNRSVDKLNENLVRLKSNREEKTMEIFVKKVMVAKFEGHNGVLYDTKEEASKSLIKYQIGMRLKTLVDESRPVDCFGDIDSKDDILRFLKENFDGLKAIFDTKYDIREM